MSRPLNDEEVANEMNKMVGPYALYSVVVEADVGYVG